MNHIFKTCRRFWRDERAAEVTELAIVLALIVAGSVAAITVLGPLIRGFYEDVGSQL